MNKIVALVPALAILLSSASLHAADKHSRTHAREEVNLGVARARDTNLRILGALLHAKKNQIARAEGKKGGWSYAKVNERNVCATIGAISAHVSPVALYLREKMFFEKAEFSEDEIAKLVAILNVRGQLLKFCDAPNGYFITPEEESVPFDYSEIAKVSSLFNQVTAPLSESVSNVIAD